jgi:co-chaperonin GroES (HSP10)
MRANGKNVLIEVGDFDDIVSKDGIFIPHHAIENSKLAIGTVVSVGKKCVLGITEGQTVLFDKHAINKYSNTVGAIGEDNVILVEK